MDTSSSPKRAREEEENSSTKKHCAPKISFEEAHPGFHLLAIPERSDTQREDEKLFGGVFDSKSNTFTEDRLKYHIGEIVKNCQEEMECDVYTNDAHSTFIVDFRNTTTSPKDYMEVAFPCGNIPPTIDIDLDILTLKYWTINNGYELVLSHYPVKINLHTLGSFIYYTDGDKLQQQFFGKEWGFLDDSVLKPMNVFAKKVRVTFETEELLDTAMNDLENAEFDEENDIFYEEVGRAIEISRKSDGLRGELNIWDDY